MFLAYVDETGDTGPVSKKGASACYSLGCLLVDLDMWPDSFDQVVAFRRNLRATCGLPVRAEIKANYLIRDSGSLRKLSLAPGKRSLIYRSHLQLLQDLRARAFAVVIDKGSGNELTGPETFHLAWETLLQRLERTSHYDQTPFMIVHDEGENDGVRKEIRKARRYLTAGMMYGSGSFSLPATALLEDPIPRNSRHSFFVQIADLIAYAGWRAYMPPSRAVAKVAPAEMWFALGSAVHKDVNRLSGGVPGVVVRST